MTRREIQTAHAPRPAGNYSQGIAAHGFLYTAGLGPQDPSTGLVVGETAEDQTRQVMLNLQSLLQEAGLGFGDVVKVTVHLANLDRDFKAFDSAYGEFVTSPPPVRTTVGSTLANILVEIDVVAVFPSSS